MTNTVREYHFLNLGAGVQSKTMALMALDGLITPMPHAMLFADTQDEPAYVYEEVARIERLCIAAGVPFYTVTKGKLSASIWKGRKTGDPKRFIQIPTFGDRGGMGRRQCTREFKIEPLIKQKRLLMGYQPRKRIPPLTCYSWIGISTDEASRMKESRNAWEALRYPLIEMRMSRRDCVLWLEAHGFSIPRKSACRYCPYHTLAEWRALKQDPVEWPQIVQIDRLLNKRGEYLHRSLMPIDEVDFASLEDKGQVNMFGNECEGVCGV